MSLHSISKWCLSLTLFLSLKAFSYSTSDTSKTLIASNSNVYHTEIYKANSFYPEILSEHKEITKDYVLQFSHKKRDYIIRMHKKGQSYFSKITKIFHQYNVPEEFRVLIILESAFNAHAVSKAGAVGFWQFMDEPAKEYGLKIFSNQRPGKSIPHSVKNVKGKPVKQYDDRSNFAKSTVAAAKYLRDRSRNLNNDYLLVAASYNWGIGNVWEAMKKTKLENPTYWDILPYVPAETKAYVMNFVALNVIFKNYDAFMKNDIRFEDVEVKKLIIPQTHPLEEVSSL